MKQKSGKLVVLVTALILMCSASSAEVVELRPAVVEKDGVIGIEYHSGESLVGRSAEAAPAGVELVLPGAAGVPVHFRTKTLRDGTIELGPATTGELTFRLRITQKNPSLVERTLEVTAKAAQQFAITFPFESAVDGELASYTGTEKDRIVYHTGVRERSNQAFPVAMLRTADRVFGIVADSPGLWENRCQVSLDPPARRLAVTTGDGGDPFTMMIKPPEDARDTYQYQMDGWQSLSAGETRRFTTWVFASPARSHYDAQVAFQLAVANAKGWNSSALEAILRNTSLYLLRRNLMRDENNLPRDGKYIFISGMTYGWKQWVSTGIYSALGLNDPEAMIEAYRAVFWHRMDYEENAQYYLIWAALAKRAGGEINEPLVQKAYDFIRRHERDGFYIPPPLPGAPHPKGWKTYMDVLHYDDDDCPASNQGFHCGALMAARELGLPCQDEDIEHAISAYQRIFNAQLGFMPTSLKQRETLGQDTLYGATLTYAVFGRKVLTDEQVLTHYRTSEKVKSPYGLRVISADDGSLLPGHDGTYCYGGSWFFCDSGNYLLAGVHGLPAAEVDARLIERIKRELVRSPAFNEDISTVTGQPHGNTPYADYSVYTWLRQQIRKRLDQSDPDPVGVAIDEHLNVLRENGVLRLDPNRAKVGAVESDRPQHLIGYNEHRTNLPGGRHANVSTNRAMVVRADGTERRAIGGELLNEAGTWTQFAGWSPDGKTAVVLRGWESVENAEWEEQHKTFRFTPEGWLVDSYLIDVTTGKAENVTAVERVSFYNTGLFFWQNDPTKLGFTALIGGVSKPFRMDRDGRNKTDLTQNSSGFAYGFSSSPDGSRISYHENYQVYLADADGSNRIHVQTGHPFVFAPSWSPDGKWVLFVSGEHYNCHPHIVRADATGLKKLADRGGYRGVTEFLDVPDYHGGSSDVPVWSVDGQSVFYTAKVGNNVALFRVTLDGHTERLTTSADGTSHYHPKPSPDGKSIVYGSKRNGVRNLFVLRLADRKEHSLTNVPAGHAAMHAYWQPVN